MYLRPRLPAGAYDADLDRSRRSQGAGGDATGRPGPVGAEEVRLDQPIDNPSLLAVLQVEDDQQAHLAAAYGVGLERVVARTGEGREQHVEDATRRVDPAPGHVLDDPLSQLFHRTFGSVDDRVH